MRIFLSIVFLFISVSAMAQIRGKITDAKTDIPLMGATITGKGTVQSDKDGIFFLEEASDFITVSIIGYETQKVETGESFLFIALQPLATELGEVIISAYEGHRKLLETSGAVSVLGKKDLERGDGISIVNVINQSPGVRMDFYTINDYRLSIRGSSISQPSVHSGGYKVYWNDIPYSAATGATSLGSFDVNNLKDIEVIRGPASSLYGAGFGGVLLLQSQEAAHRGNSIGTEAQIGSYHTHRVTTSADVSTDKVAVSAQFTHLESDGYRDNSFSNAKYGNIYAQFYGDKSITSLLANYNYRRTGIAGDLTEEQVAENPRQSTMLPSEGFGPEFAGVGLNNKYIFNEKWQNSASIYYQNNYGGLFTLKAPYYSIYEKELGSNLALRNTLTYIDDLGSVHTRIAFGIEHIHSNSKVSSFDGGFNEPLLETNESMITNTTGFAQGEFTFPKDWIVTLGASYNSMYYRLQSYVDPSYFTDALNNFSPRISLLKKMTDNTSVYASYSRGFDAPMGSDFNNHDGTFNKNLKPTTGGNAEFGFRSRLFNNKLFLDAAVYQTNLDNALVTVLYNPSAGVSIEQRENAGKIRQQGIEAILIYKIFSSNDRFIKDASLQLNYSYNHYTYKNYVTVKEKDDGSGPEEVDYSGKQIPGVNPNTLTASFDLYTQPGFYLTAAGFYYDRQYLTYDNTITFKSYQYLNLKIGYNKYLSNQWELNAYAGINNATGAEYSGLLSYNDSYGAYYNPAPTANYYGGLGLKFHF